MTRPSIPIWNNGLPDKVIADRVRSWAFALGQRVEAIEAGTEVLTERQLELLADRTALLEDILSEGGSQAPAWPPADPPDS